MAVGIACKRARKQREEKKKRMVNSLMHHLCDALTNILFDFFNALNNNAITQVNTSYGTPAQMQRAFGPDVFLPVSILNPRLIRFNVRVSY